MSYKPSKGILLVFTLGVLLSAMAYLSFTYSGYDFSGFATQEDDLSIYASEKPDASKKLAASSSLQGGDNIGVYRPSTSTFYLRNSNTQGDPDVAVVFGVPGDMPVVGDWNGDGFSTIGVYRPSTSMFFLSNSIEKPNADMVIKYGIKGDVPVIGDFDGDGIDSIGVYRKGSKKEKPVFMLLNSLETPEKNTYADISVQFGTSDGVPVIGDWNGDGVDTIGIQTKIKKTQQKVFSLRNSNKKGAAEIVVQRAFNSQYDMPLSGDFDGDGIDNPGAYVNYREGIAFYLSDEILKPTPKKTIGNWYVDTYFLYGKNNDIALVGRWLVCDRDKDGYKSILCDGNDCDDYDAKIHVDASEICGNELKDDNCNDAIDESCSVQNCPDGVVRCNDNKAERCTIDPSSKGYYIDDSSKCIGSICEAYTLDVGDNQIGRTGCSTGLSYVNDYKVSSNFGALEFPPRVNGNDFRIDCVGIGYGYYWVDAGLCPNLSLMDGESMNVELYLELQDVLTKSILIGLDGSLEKCPGEICENQTYSKINNSFGMLSYSIKNFDDLLSSPMKGGKNQGGIGQVPSGKDCTTECEDCCRTCTSALDGKDCIDEVCESNLLPIGSMGCENGYEYIREACSLKVINTGILGDDTVDGRHKKFSNVLCEKGCGSNGRCKPVDRPKENPCKEKEHVACIGVLGPICCPDGQSWFSNSKDRPCIKEDGDCCIRREVDGTCCKELTPTGACNLKSCTAAEIQEKCKTKCGAGNCDTSNECKVECNNVEYTCGYGGPNGCEEDEFCKCVYMKEGPTCYCKSCDRTQKASSIQYSLDASSGSCENCKPSQLCDDGTCCISGPCIGNTCSSECPSQNQCGSACCDENQLCSRSSGKCIDQNECPVGNEACGSQCCKENEACVDDKCNSLCPSGKEACGSQCCKENEVCDKSNNQCIGEEQCSGILCKGVCCPTRNYLSDKYGNCVCCNRRPAYNPYFNCKDASVKEKCDGDSGRCSCNPNNCDYPSCWTCF